MKLRGLILALIVAAGCKAPSPKASAPHHVMAAYQGQGPIETSAVNFDVQQSATTPTPGALAIQNVLGTLKQVNDQGVVSTIGGGGGGAVSSVTGNPDAGISVSPTTGATVVGIGSGAAVLQTVRSATCTVQTPGSGVQDINFTTIGGASVAGNADGKYTLDFVLVVASSAIITAQPNSLTTNQKYAGWFTNGVTMTQVNGTTMLIDGDGNGTVKGRCVFDGKAGFGPRYYYCDIFDGAYELHQTGWWNDSTTAISNWNFHASAAGGFAVGTSLELCKEMTP